MNMPMSTGSSIPDLEGASQWLPEKTHLALVDKVVLIHFWSFSCPSCHANMPHLQELRDRYESKGMCTIAVHMPDGPFALDLERVEQAVSDLGVTEPCAIDNQHIIGDRFGVTAWPTYFLFDANGKLRRHARGNFGVRMIEQSLIRLFEETSKEEQLNHENTQSKGFHAH